MDGHQDAGGLTVAEGRLQTSEANLRSVEASLIASEARFAAMVEHGSDLISISDPEGRLVYASPAYRTVLGYEPSDCIGQLLQDQIHPDDRAHVMTIGMDLAASPGASATLDFRYAHADGSWRWVEATLTNRLDDPAVGGFITNTRDVTDRVLATERLAHQATHDALTGLANRMLLDDRIVQVRAAAVRHGEIATALYVDIDHFKQVNDHHGHATGDLLLTEVARRLRSAARVDDTVIRLGGDEFVLLASVVDEAAAYELASRMCGSFTEPFVLGEQMLAITASVGVATTADPDRTVDLLEAADLALYEAKAVGRNRWVAYLPRMRRRPASGIGTQLPSAERLDPASIDSDRRARGEGSELERIGDRYRAYIAEATEALVVHVDGVIVAASPGALQLAGVDSEGGVIGKHVFDLVTEGSLSQARAREEAVLGGGWPRPEVFDIETVGTGSLTVEVASTPVLWDGQLASQLTMRRVDDTWEEIIRIGTELTESITQAVILTDLEYKVVAWNDEATQLYGWAREEVLGRSLVEMAMWDRPAEDLLLASRELEMSGHWKGTMRHLRRDGATIAVACDAHMIHGHDGNPLGMVSVNALAAQSDAEAEADVLLLGELATAIASGQLAMAYQPVVDAAGNVVKVEALVRWHHPTRGLLLPGEFIPLAERSPLLASLTAQILLLSCEQVAAWRRHEMPALELTVNVSAHELCDPSLVDRVMVALDASGLPAEALWLEITETALAQDADRAGAALAQLCSLGIRIALDDFGTGFASLSQLHRFPAHALKIDRMFVDGMVTSEGGDAAIVRTVLALGRELGLSVIAEGVETAVQRAALLRMGCTLFQGYYFARPAFAEPPPAWLHADGRVAAVAPTG